MRSSQPPVVATWVLTSFCNRNEVLAGDLAEEYQRGRSVAWYWRQVIVAILVGCGNEIRTHKLLTVTPPPFCSSWSPRPSFARCSPASAEHSHGIPLGSNAR